MVLDLDMEEEPTLTGGGPPSPAPGAGAAAVALDPLIGPTRPPQEHHPGALLQAGYRQYDQQLILRWAATCLSGFLDASIFCNLHPRYIKDVSMV